MIYEEEYKVQITKQAEFQKLVEDFGKMVKELKLPFLKDWYVAQNKYVPGHVREVWVLEEQANVDKMWELAMGHPEFMKYPPKFFEIMVDGSYESSFWAKIATI